MKTVIRKNVFETNSSSTHSLSIKGRATSKCASKGAAFELRSPLAKAVQMIGLIDNAQQIYHSSGCWLDEDETAIAIKKKIVDKIKEHFPQKIGDKKAEDFTAQEVNFILDEIDDGLIFGEYGEKSNEFFGENDYMAENFFIIDRADCKILSKFREYIIEEYAQKVGKSKEEGLKDLEFEAFANIEIKEILQNEQTAEKKLRDNMLINYKFKQEFEESGEQDIIKFAKNFLVKDFEEFKAYRNGKFSCERYFCNGCLDSCFCGFESMLDIVHMLDLNGFDDLALRKKAKWLMSNQCRIVGEEKYAGIMPDESGDIF